MTLVFGDPNAIRARDAKPNARNRTNHLVVPKFPKERKPMSDLEIKAALKLGRCHFGQATWDQGFARTLEQQAKKRGDITDNMRYHLWRMVQRYRRQILDEGLVQHAATWIANLPAQVKS